MSAMPRYRPLIVLRQVEGTQWCVVRHRFEGAKRVFDARIATARPYARACQAAIEAATLQRLPLGIEANGVKLRRFDPKKDAWEAAQ
ncbi:hypothetical protein ACFOKI_02925 [Sphingomonas qilianensis]|uniref:DUF2188 domain-containing protein n=1 Tax=Sphingomonas qilianensis TaxID=1736690 RepID=A0ABU9XVJ4_9SPHN